jgi:pyruvate dehydrogenase E2 component (dihydrolipoamide acetyltransferase)
VASEFKLPELGENVESGDLVKLLVKVGDSIQENQPVLELETEKAAIEVPSTVAGKVQEIRVKEGEKIKVGQVILTVEDGAARKPAEAQVKERAARAEPEVQPPPSQPERQAQPPSPPPAMQKQEPARAAEQPVAVAEPPRPAGPPQGQERRTPPLSIADYQPAREPVPAAPSVRRVARELGVDINDVVGSGPAGRISQEDVVRRAKEIISSPAVGATAAAKIKLPDFSKWGDIERTPMRSVRRSTAEHLTQAWTIPHVTQYDKVDITELDKLRQRYSKEAENAGGKLTVTAIALKVIASALKRFPQFAASIDTAREEIIYKRYYHIGVAVDTERGLLVPVIRDVDKKGIVHLAVELAQASEKARNRQLSMGDMEGGVFTITNLGGIGGTYFSPIINSPEVAILGISRSSTEPVYVDGEFRPRLMLPLSLSYDHRLIDGADAARFIRWVAEAFEQPFLLSLHG